MDNKAIVKELKSLCQLDIDAIHAYDQAIGGIDSSQIRLQIEKFKADHHRHVKELSEQIRAYGEEPPSFSPDLKGYLLEAFTKMRSVTGTEGALKGLKGGEELTNRSYGNAVKLGFPVEIKAIIEKNFKDEQRHLQYVNDAIKSRLWEEAA